MQKKNNKGKILAIAGLAAVLVFAFVVVPKLIANPPETSEIITVPSNTDSIAEPEPEPELKNMEIDAVADEPEYQLMLNSLPDVNQISWEQAFESAAKALRDYGYDVEVPDPLEEALYSGVWNGFHIIYECGGDPVYDPVCRVYLKYDHVVPGEINIQEYLESEAFKGMSEAEIREIIDADDLSVIEYKPNTKHPKFKVLEQESCKIYFEIELNSYTGEVLRGWETRVRFGEELAFGEVLYFGLPIWDKDGYYTQLYY